MLDTTMPRARQAATSTLSVPVAATATRRSRPSCPRMFPGTGALLTIAIVASRSKAATSPGATRSCSIQVCANDGLRTFASIEPRSRKTMCSSVSPMAVSALSPHLASPLVDRCRPRAADDDVQHRADEGQILQKMVDLVDALRRLVFPEPVRHPCCDRDVDDEQPGYAPGLPADDQHHTRCQLDDGGQISHEL